MTQKANQSAELAAEKRGPGRPRKHPITPVVTKPEKAIKRRELCRRLDISVRTSYRLEQDDPDFPRAFLLAGTKHFLESETDRYLLKKAGLLTEAA